MVIGAYQDDDKGTNSGSAYVFTRDTPGDLASGWTQVAKLTADDGAVMTLRLQRLDRRRHDGDRGALTTTIKGDNSGSAYVFTRDTAGDLASGWTQVAKLTAGDGAASDYFGYSVSIDGDTVVIGALRTTTRDPTAGPRTCTRATRPATSPPTGRRSPS